jgi:hypothetical protein
MIEQIRSQLDYDPETGIFRWKAAKGNAAAGSVAGYVRKDRYTEIKVNGTKYKAHRLAWMIHYGVVPDREVDHINNDTQDNRIINLRLATREENSWNSPRRDNNTSGVKGVSYHKKSEKWQAAMDFMGKRIYLGIFETKEAASEAIKSLRQSLHGEFVNHG